MNKLIEISMKLDIILLLIVFGIVVTGFYFLSFNLLIFDDYFRNELEYDLIISRLQAKKELLLASLRPVNFKSGKFLDNSMTETQKENERIMHKVAWLDFQIMWLKRLKNRVISPKFLMFLICYFSLLLGLLSGNFVMMILREIAIRFWH